MKLILLLILTINLIVPEVYAQVPKLEYRKRTKLRESAYLEQLGIRELSDKKIQVEVRIWKDNYGTGQTKMIRLMQSKNNDWIAQSLDYYCYNTNSCEKEKGIVRSLNLKANCQQSWQKIISLNLLDLPDQNELNKKVRAEAENILVVADGRSWTVEVITKKGKWKKVYNNPQSFAEFYNKSGDIAKEYVKPMNLFSELERAFDWRFLAKEVN